MSSRATTAIILLSIAISGVVLANMFLIMMIGEINRQRGEGNLISYFGFTLPKMLHIFREYRRLYPNGKLHLYALASFAAAMLGLITVAICLHIIG